MSLHLMLSLHFKIQYFWCEHLSVPDFRVSTAILNPVEVFRRLCKLSFRAVRDQVLSHAIFLNR